MVDPSSLGANLRAWCNAKGLAVTTNALVAWPDARGTGGGMARLPMGATPGNAVEAGATPNGGKAVHVSVGGMVFNPFALYESPEASSQYNGSYSPIDTIDGITSTWGWATAANPSVGSPQWIIYKPINALIATSIQIRLQGSTNRGPKDFKVQGSNDKSSWTDLYTSSAPVWVSGTETKSFSCGPS
jgi:hypothetical protein